MVAEHMRGDSFFGQRRADLLGLGDVPSDQSLDGIWAETAAARARKQER
jgi:hypothetical protein